MRVALEQLLDPIMRPLLNLDPILAVAIVAFIVSVIITVIYKFTTNQNLMKQLKDEMKEFQKEMKELREHPEEMMKVQKKAMETNMKYMMQSFKSTIFTILPIILIFGWMNANYAYESISPEEQFQIGFDFAKGSMGNVSVYAPEGIEVIGDKTQDIINDKALFTFKGNEGDYIENRSLKFEYNQRLFFKDIIITNSQEYAKKQELIKDSNLKSITIDYKKKVILPVINWGWLGTYIIFSIVFSMLLRRWLKVY
jgi:uncharacterized membrane protein (DUF106 family)